MDIPSCFGSTHLVVCGPTDAPPLVLIHGVQASLTMWAYNIGELSREYRVYALDAMGQWTKSVPDQPIRNRAELAEWLTATLDTLGLGQIPLVGMSYGGWIALNYAMHEPARLSKLVLLSPAGGLAPLAVQFIIRTAPTQFLPGLSWFFMSSLMRWMCYKENLRNEQTRQMWEHLTKQMALGARYSVSKSVQVPPQPFTDEELQRVKTPTLLLIGQQEVLYDPVVAVTRAKRLIPNIQAELIPHASHEMTVSHAETVNKRVLEFLKE